MKFLLTACLALALLLGPRSLVAIAEDNPEGVADGPWITAVQWQDNDQLVGTRSQGLLFRSAEVVRMPASDPSMMEVVGQAETSLWALLAVDGGRVVASDYKGGVHLFGGEQPKAFELDARWIRALSPTPSQGEILAGTEDGKLLVLSLSEAKELRRVDAHAAAIFDIAVSAAGDKVATAGGDGTIKVFSWPKLEPLGQMSLGNQAVWSVAFVADDSRLVSGGADRAIQLWDVAAAKPIVSLAMAHNWVTSLAVLPESELVVVGGMDGELTVADFRTMQPVTTQAGPGSAIWALALSPDGKRLAVGTRKHGVSVVEVADWLAAGKAAAEKADAIRPPAPAAK